MAEGHGHPLVIMMVQSEILSTSQVIFIKLFPTGVQRCCTLYHPQQTVQLCGDALIYNPEEGERYQCTWCVDAVSRWPLVIT